MANTAKVNLYVTYKKVWQRVARSQTPAIRQASEAAAAAAASLIELPTIVGALAFRKIERKWLTLASGNARALADEFEHAIRANNWEVTRPRMNARHAGWSPKHGMVYCLTCAEMPGCVKVGATTLTIKKRVQLLSGSKSLTRVRVTLSLEVNEPSIVEDEAHKALRANRVPGPGPRGRTSNEWFKVSPKAAEDAVRAAAVLRAR